MTKHQDDDEERHNHNERGKPAHAALSSWTFVVAFSHSLGVFARTQEYVVTGMAMRAPATIQGGGTNRGISSKDFWGANHFSFSYNQCI